MCDNVVSTPNGQIKGEVFDLKRKDAKLVYKYRNIPFAKPPVGNLRFMAPQPAEPWDGVRNGTTLGNKPMYNAEIEDLIAKYFPFSGQGKRNHDEDCLHLSVYTPSTEKGKKLPVMMWIYGGGFSMGSERDYDGSILAGMNDVVVVVPNYRVGIFGFFSLGPNSICPGNQGIMDQQQALRWVQENIEAFGGDKDNVTIFGQSAGSASVGMHIMSPLSRGLFHKAISHSGTSTIPGAFHDEKSNAKSFKRLLEINKIEEKDETKILEKLQQMTADELVKMSSSMELIMDKVHFQPIFGDKVFPKNARDSLKAKDFAKVPYIIGCNSTEGQGIMAASAGPDFEKGLTEEAMKQFIFFPITDEGFDLCKKFYLKPGDEDPARYSKMLGEIVGDAMFVAPSVQVADAYSEAAGVDVYVYYGDFNLKMFHEDEYRGEMVKKADWCICDHGDDIHMTFGIPLAKDKLPYGAKYSEGETKLSEEFMAYLTNFARTGNPNKGKKVNVTWPKYKPKDKAHLVVAIPCTADKNLEEKAVNFWLNDMEKYTKREAQ